MYLRDNSAAADELCPFDSWSSEAKQLIRDAMDALEEAFEHEELDKIVGDIIQAVVLDGGMS